MTPDGSRAYVTNYGGNSVTPITVSSNTAGSAIAVGTNPFGVAFSPDGTKAYVANIGSNNVTPITVSSSTPGTAIAVGGQPYGVAFSPDGSTAYVANYLSNTVTPITTTTNSPGATIETASGPLDVAFVPDQAPVASFVSSGTLQTGSSISFDASASTVAFGTIAGYSWNFGDGATATGATAYAYVHERVPLSGFGNRDR